MRIKKNETLLVVIFIGCFFPAFCNYKVYKSDIAKAEKQFMQKNYKSSIELYKQILESYKYPYAKETMQAAYVCCYAKDSVCFRMFIEKAFSLGMSIDESKNLFSTWNRLNESKMDSKAFEKFRKLYIQNLNWLKLIEYVKLDVYREYLLKTFPLEENDHKAFYDGMKTLRNRYLALIDTFGYVANGDTGRRINFSLKPKSKNENNFLFDFKNDSFLKAYFGNKQISIQFDNGGSIFSSSDPGAWFLSHYVPLDHINFVDTVLFEKIKEGVNQLKADPYLLVNLLESTKTTENDFMLTYYSKTWLDLRMIYISKYRLANEVKVKINKNRIQYGFKTLEEEEEMLRFLYHLKTNKNLDKDFTNKDLNEISFENRLFLQVMV